MMAKWSQLEQWDSEMIQIIVPQLCGVWKLLAENLLLYPFKMWFKILPPFFVSFLAQSPPQVVRNIHDKMEKLPFLSFLNFKQDNAQTPITAEDMKPLAVVVHYCTSYLTVLLTQVLNRPRSIPLTSNHCS